MRKKRYNYSPEEKVSILRRHLVEHIAVSDLLSESPFPTEAKQSQLE
jgi:hypothetical protein